MPMRARYSPAPRGIAENIFLHHALRWVLAAPGGLLDCRRRTLTGLAQRRRIRVVKNSENLSDRTLRGRE